ncbi:UNVERIFIED_ORG: hypothetical protein B2H93_04340 [Clostridium botulinum]
MKNEYIEFLKNLQHEMLTQDTVGQADPRFWAVMETKRRYGIDDKYGYDGSVIIGDEGEECEIDMNSIYNWIQKDLEIECFYNGKDIIIEENILSDVEDVINYLNICTNGIYTICNYKDEDIIVQNTMFLTLRECEEHIKRNSYHYTKPHPYAMTAWRSPQVERLYKILQETNWNKLKEDIN